ncbi:MAG: restriction endonuclease subunit S [Verrucomicrobiae bacterium]|nr:restriction endonuclease subunit S [Verrucomicrobiae bacterium]
MSAVNTKTIPLGDLVRFEGGGTPSKAIPEYWNGDIPWASVKDITSLELSRTSDSISTEGLKNSASRVVPKGNVIIPTRMALGRAAINTVDVAINQDLRVAYPNGSLDRRYLLWYIIANAKQIETLGSGATVKGITLEKLRELPVPIPHKNGKPDLDEQKRIAAILDKADAIRRKRQQALRLTDDLLRSVFLDMFGDPVTNPKNWGISRASEVFESFRYGTSIKCSEIQANENQLPVLRIPNVAAEQVNWNNLKYGEISDSELARLRLKSGDILFVRTNGNPELVGRCAMFSGKRDAVYASYIIRGRLNPEFPALPAFIHNLFCTDRLRSEIRKMATTSAGNFNVNTKSLGSLPVILPPLELQKEFVRINTTISSRVTKCSAVESESKELFGALQQRAFKGEL